nr:NADH dehydrogenase subunit 2 [Alectorobius amblus]
MFFWFLTLSILMSLSSSSLFFLWICLEVNMMSFIPLMFNKNLFSMNGIISYFLIQSISSSFYIFSISILFLNPFFLKYITFFVLLSMLIKLGASPFHMWLPQVSESLTYNNLVIFLTIQKIIPLQILSIFKNYYIIIPIILSSAMGAMGGFNQFSIRKILAFSSISHLAWMMTLLMLCSNLWIIYMTIYLCIIMMITTILKKHKINFFNFSKKNNPSINLMLIILLLSLGGMPPTIGFIMKWMTLKIILSNFMVISIPLIASSLVNLYFYLRLIHNAMFKYLNSYKWEKFSSYNFLLFTIFQMTSIFIMIPLI